MKSKFLIPILCSIAIGFFFGKVFFTEYDNNTLTTFNEGEKMYFIQKGVYSNLNTLKKSNEDYNDFLYIEENNKYYFYVGITKSEKIAKIIKEFYSKTGNNIYIKEIYIDNYAFSSLVNEYDKLSSITSNDSLIQLQKIVISNYKEMVVNGEDLN